MFVRIKKHPGSKNYSVMICESYREFGKSYNKVIRFLGVASEPNKIQALKEEGEAWLAELKAAQANPITPTDPNHILSINTREVCRLNVGIKDIMGKLYEQLGFNLILPRKVGKVLKQVVLSRFSEPSSKRKTSFTLERKFGEEVSLDSIYYMMDQLEGNLTKSQEIVFNKTKEALGDSIDLILFDVTTLYFESIKQDELKEYGYSKDNKYDTTQVTLALATSKEGLPIGYKLFPGNTAEVSTLIESVEYWRKTLFIGEVIIVGDRGMMSRDNVLKLQQANFRYIIAYPLKKATSSLKEQILNKDKYEGTTICGESYLKQELDVGDRERLIITFNEKRRNKDCKTREKLIEKLKKKLGTSKRMKGLITNSGYLKYTKVDSELVAEINEDKIQEDTKWDGLHGILTNTTLSAEEVVARYKNLWVIEESFRINKHSLQMRPIYHYTPRRIRAHIEICYLTFALVRHAQHILKAAGLVISIEELRDELLPIEASIICDLDNGKIYRLPGNMTMQAKEIYKAFGRQNDLQTQLYEAKKYDYHIKYIL